MKHVIRLLSQAKPALLKRRKLAFGSAGVLLVIFVIVFALSERGDHSALAQPSESENETSLSTVAPVLVSDSSSALILGTVLSHETANIYPRRDGIVEDIFVDIGDAVEKNQVVALLLPKGVEGQSAAKIAEKNARKSEAESNLITAEHVAEETIIGSRQKISEKETELLIALREQEALLEKFVESEAHIDQMQEQAFTVVQNTTQTIEWILLGSNSRSGMDIFSEDLLRNLGIQDSSNTSRYSVVEAFNTLSSSAREYRGGPAHQQSTSIDYLFTYALEALQITNTLLQYTPSEITANGFDRITHEQLTDRLNKITSAQDSIFKAKEKLEDARLSFQTLASAEPELFDAYQSGLTEGTKSNKVRMLEEQIRTANNTLALTEANQQQVVERQKSMVEIADAQLRLEYANSGHREIRSPFKGIVSKRFIDVGQIVMPSKSAFELTDVPTSLAKKAKAEIRFGLPEHLISALEVGDSVAFFLQTDETQEYEAEVTRKSPQVDMTTHTITVQAKVPDDLSLPHQSSVRIRLTDERKPVFRVPSSAVKREDDRNLLWILDSETNKPMQIDVSVVAEDGEFAELTGDISDDSKIILDPPDLFLTQDQQ